MEGKDDKRGEVIRQEQVEGSYYLWVKIISGRKEKVSVFGPYNLTGIPTEDNLICTIEEKSDNDTKGKARVGTNKTFEGWTLIYQLNNGEETPITEGTTLVDVVKNDIIVVKYKKEGFTEIVKTVTITELKIGYTLTYDANGGTGGPGTETQYDNNVFTISSTVPTRAGYTFKGWNTNASGTGTTYTTGTITISENTTLYAQWEEKETTATLTITNNKLTEGTQVAITGNSEAGLTKVEVLIGTQTVYTENINTTSYSKTIDINNLSNLKNLTFNSSYTAKLNVTASTGKVKTISVDNVKNYTVGSANSLKTLATAVNGGTTFQGITVYQIADIDLSTVCSSTKGTWTLIGYNSTNAYPFNGTYNGNGKNITNLYINNSEDKSVGLFGLLGYTGTVKNLTISGEVTQLVYAKVAGGIVGKNEGTIENCINYSKVTQNAKNAAGGISGGNENKINNCINYGNINGIGSVGGITGYMNSNKPLVSNTQITNISSNISGCENNGSITANVEGSFTGGILGRNDGGTITKCKNNSNAQVTGVSNVGGICGFQYIIEGNVLNITECTNEGNVTATSSITGGIVGYSEGNITSCKNTGAVTSEGNPSDERSTQGTGGIVGRICNGATISRSSNTGNITATTGFFAGGIVGFGYGNATINECYNYNGNIVAGIKAAAGILATSQGTTINNCYNYLSSSNYYIKSNGQNVGGIMAVIHNSSTSTTYISNCYNIGENITATEGNKGSILAIVGYSSEIKNNYYLSSSSLSGIGIINVTPTVNTITQKADSNFKLGVSNTSSVAYLLNGNKTSGVWSQSSSVNGGYPYLVNNKP